MAFEARVKRRFKDAAYAELAAVPTVLANKSRLELLDLVAQRPRSVQELAAEAALSVANASQHLQVLARGGLVFVQRRGRHAFYRANPAAFALLAAVHELARSTTGLARVRARFAGGGAEITSIAELRALLRDPHCVLLDVRPRDEYAAAHLPGAVSAPLDALKAGAFPLSAVKRYVVSCRGPLCVFADEAVALLAARGLHATRVALGPVEWVAAGERLQRAG